MKIETYWNDFLQLKGLDKNTQYLESFHFDLTEKSAKTIQKALESFRIRDELKLIISKLKR